MDISLLFKFPGILILIGVILLIIAIVIGIIAYKTPSPEEETPSPDLTINNEEVELPEGLPPREEEGSIHDLEPETPLPESITGESVTKESLDYTPKEKEEDTIEPIEIKEENKEESIPEIETTSVEESVTPIVEDKSSSEIEIPEFKIEETKTEEQDKSVEELANKIKEESKLDINEDIKEEPKEENKFNMLRIEEEPIEPVKEETASAFPTKVEPTKIEPIKTEAPLFNISEDSPFAEDKESTEEVKEEIETPVEEPVKEEPIEETSIDNKEIYGGIKPLDDIKLDFEERPKPLYSEKHVAEPVPRLVEDKKEEDIEVL